MHHILAPYLIAGALATLVLLASGTLAVAPYVRFLSSVAAFNVALPVALSLSILSILVLALSCKIISNNKKIEVEKNKFAEKEQELESKIALGKEAASKEVEELKDQLTRKKQDANRVKEVNQLKVQLAITKQQLDGAIKELSDKNSEIQELKSEIENLDKEIQELRVQNTEPSAKVEDQLKHRGEMLSFEHQELRDKNSRIGKLESGLQKLTDRIAQEKKAKENVGGEVKGLNNQLSGLTQEKQDLEGEIEELGEKIKSLNERLNGAQQTLAKKKQELEQEREDFYFELEEMKYNHKTDMDKFKKQAEERLKDKEISVLSVVKERVEQGLSGSEEQQYIQDTDHIQEAVDKFMQPIYEKLGINNQLDISSKHLSELEGTGENKLANGLTFTKPLFPHTSTPRGYLRNTAIELRKEWLKTELKSQK